MNQIYLSGEIISAKTDLKVAGSSGEKMTLLGSGFDEGEPIQVCVRPEAAVYSKGQSDGFSKRNCEKYHICRFSVQNTGIENVRK